MKHFTLKTLTLALCATSSMMVLTGCGSDNNDNNTPAPTPAATQTLKGTAATGKAFAGKIIVKNNSGQQSSAIDIKADGSFEVVVPKGEPYLIKAYNDKTGDQATTLYSYSADGQTQLNVTQLTTQAIFAANGQASLNALYDNWDKQNTLLTAAKIEEAAKKVAANLERQFAAANIDAKTLNIFSYAFKPDGSGFDGVLDKVQIAGFNNCNVSSCAVSYRVNGVDYAWNYQISTTGFNWTISNPGGNFGGNYNLKVTTSINGSGNSVEIKGVPKPDNQQAFCDGADVKQQLPTGFVINSCSFSGNTGTIAATVSAGGFNISYSVKYEYSPA